MQLSEIDVIQITQPIDLQKVYNSQTKGESCTKKDITKPVKLRVLIHGMATAYYGGDKMVKRRLVMTVGTYKNRQQATTAAKNFRKGSKTDMKPGYSISYRVEKASKNSKFFKVVSTLKPKKMASKKKSRTYKKR